MNFGLSSLSSFSSSILPSCLIVYMHTKSNVKHGMFMYISGANIPSVYYFNIRTWKITLVQNILNIECTFCTKNGYRGLNVVSEISDIE